MQTRFPFKKAIVTGGAGFIGSYIVEELVKLGVETISMDNYLSGKHENLSHLDSYPNFHEVKCDITDAQGLEKYFDGVEVVFHQAASKKVVCMKKPGLDLQVNAGGTFTMLDLSIKHGVKKFIHASTGSVYGLSNLQQEDQSPRPTSFYGVSKLAGENYVDVFRQLYGLDTVILRYFHVYGARQDTNQGNGVISIFSRNILRKQPVNVFGDGYQERSFTYVKDIVKANILAAMTPSTTGQIFNCASGIKVTLNNLIRILRESLRINDIEVVYQNPRLDDTKKFDIRNEKILRVLGMEFTDFTDGLNETISWEKQYVQTQKLNYG